MLLLDQVDRCIDMCNLMAKNNEPDMAVLFFRKATLKLTVLNFDEVKLSKYIADRVPFHVIEAIEDTIESIQNTASPEYARWEDAISFINTI